MKVGKKIEPGLIVEIETSRGLAYAQYTHYHSDPPRFGALIRVMEGIFRERPQDISVLANRPTQFQTFYPVKAAIRQGFVRAVGSAPIPAEFQRFPIFRNTVDVRNNPDGDQWWLWDGQRSWFVGKLTKEQQEYPLEQLVMHPILVRRIETGWTAKSPHVSIGLAVSTGTTNEEQESTGVGPSETPSIATYLRMKPGALLEFKTSEGLAYAQYTHNNKRFGELIRVIEGFFNERPGDLERLAAGPTRFQAFYPAQLAIKQGVADLVGTARVPPSVPGFRFSSRRTTLQGASMETSGGCGTARNRGLLVDLSLRREISP